MQGQPKDKAENHQRQSGAQAEMPKPNVQNLSALQNEGRIERDSSEQPKSGKNSKFDLDRRAVEAAENSALWAKYGVYVGAAGIIFVVLTLFANAGATWISYKQFEAANPPIIDIEQIVLNLSVGPVNGSLIISNEGNSTAFKLNPIVAGICAKSLPQQHITQVVQNYGAVFEKLHPHEMHHWSFFNAGQHLTIRQIRDIRAKRTNFYVVGIIWYQTSRWTRKNNIHRTLFCRQYNPDTDRYEPVDDRYYEYKN